MSQFNIDEIEKRTLSGLKDFQRATVERVDYLFRHNQNRVLVADEVGKLAEESTRSVTAIQETIEKVQKAFEDLKDNSQELLVFIDEKIQPQMDGYLQISEDYYTDSDEVDNLAAEPTL